MTGCTRGECTSLQHNTCPNDRACYDSSCIGEQRKNIEFPLKFCKNQTRVDQPSVAVHLAATQRQTAEPSTISRSAPALLAQRGNPGQIGEALVGGNIFSVFSWCALMVYFLGGFSLEWICPSLQFDMLALDHSYSHMKLFCGNEP